MRLDVVGPCSFVSSLRCRDLRRGAVILLAALLLSPGSTSADCGDEIDGARVACRCGDVVVGDATLRSDDPVVLERCEGDGLIVRAAAGRASLRLDLAGLSIVGSGFGSGIRVLDGGGEGAVVVGGPAGRPGAIVGFDTGLRATKPGSLSHVSDLIVRGNDRDGIFVRGDETILENVVCDENGRDGMRVGGRSTEILAVRSTDNGRFGARASGRSVRGSLQAARNGRAALATTGVLPASGEGGVEVTR